MSRMALKIATGTQVFNALSSSAAASTTSPLGPSGTAAVACAGYSATGFGGASAGLPTLLVADAAAFPAGTYIVCDDDYDNSSYGFVGDAGANVFQGAVTDVDFIRRTSDFVGCVSLVVESLSGGQDGLVLTGPLVGGGMSSSGTGRTEPGAAAKIQKITGYISREGGTFISEWSGIFLLDTIDASQILLYYPRLSPDTFVGMPATNLQNATSMQQYELEASFDAMAFDDPLDGETVVRYSAYYPKPGPVNIQI